MKTIFTEEMIATLKTKNAKDILAQMLEEVGAVERAEEVRSATRLTDKLIDTVTGPLVEETEEVAEEVVGCDVSTMTSDDINAVVEEITAEKKEAKEKGTLDLTEKLDALEKAIAKGKKKKAKKIVAELEEAGLSGSVFKDLKKQVKGL
jgi:hypothetical protein